MLTELKKLATDFSAKPLTRGREMRELLERAPDDFCSAAIEVLSSDFNEQVQRYLVALLWTNNLLIQCLTHPATPAKKAEDIATMARRVDPQLPSKLIGFVMDRTDADSSECLDRIVGLLRSMPDVAAFRPMLTPLLNHPNPRIRSKIASLAGEGNRNLTWFARRLQEDDPRVRANVIESGGITAGEDLKPVFRAALSDPNNRVVGNALLALYRLGDEQAIGGLCDLLSRPEPVFRATAAWAMAETGDTRFLPLLTGLLTRPNETIKAAALKAIRRLRERENAEAQCCEKQNGTAMTIRVLGEPSSLDSNLQVDVEVATAGEPVAGLAGTAVRPRVNGQLVYHYSLVEQKSTRRISAAFLLPRTNDRGLIELHRAALEPCFQRRRVGDSWLVAQYSVLAAGAAPARPETLFGVRLDLRESADILPIPSLEDLRLSLEPRVSGHEFAKVFGELCHSLHSSMGNAQLFLIRPEEAPGIEPAGLIRLAREARTTVHSVCGTHHPRIREVCRGTGGCYVVGESVADILPALYRGIFHRYSVTLTPKESVRQVEVIVHTPESHAKSPPVNVID